MGVDASAGCVQRGGLARAAQRAAGAKKQGGDAVVAGQTQPAVQQPGICGVHAVALQLTLIATLAACEMGLKLSGVELHGSGVQAAMDYFADHPAPV